MRTVTCRRAYTLRRWPRRSHVLAAGLPSVSGWPHRLENIYAPAKASGHLARFIVFGSFVTAKPAPNDVDIFLLMSDGFGSK
jgi:hypothetical protein